MKQEKLLDSYSFSTTSFEEAYNHLAELDEALEVVKIRTGDIGLISYIDTNEDGKFITSHAENASVTNVQLSQKNRIPKFYEMDRRAITNNYTISDNFVEEFKSNGYALILNKRIILCSNATLGTICTRCGVSGEGFLESSVLRNAFLNEKLKKKNSAAHLILRRSVGESGDNNTGLLKAFGVLGSAYAPVEQMTLKRIVEKCEENLNCKAVLKEFISDNYITRMYIEFPEISDDFAKTYNLPDRIVPGVCISTSDIGDSSLTVWGTVRIKGETPIFYGEYARKHSGNIDIDDIVAGAEKNVFAEFVKAPEKLLEMLTINVTNPKEAIKFVSKELKLVKVLGKANTMALEDALTDELDDSLSYTAYDIATMFMSSARRVEGIAKSLVLLYQKKVIDVLFIDFSKQKSGLFLTA